MFLCGGAPVLLAIYTLSKVKESDRWVRSQSASRDGIFSPLYRRRTVLNAGLVTVSIIGLWAGAVYEPSAIVTLARKAGHSAMEATRLASFGTGLLSIGTVLGCLAAPPLAERLGRRGALAFFFLGMALCIWLSFGWAFYVPGG
jgi:MFS family permease